MTVRSRLLLGFGSMLVLILGLSVFAIYNGRETQDLFQTVARRNSLALLDQTAQSHVLAGRLQVWIALGTGDASRWGKAAEAFKSAHENTAELVRRTIDPTRQKLAKQLDGLVTEYKGRAATLHTYKNAAAASSRPEGRAAIAAALQTGAEITSLRPRCWRITWRPQRMPRQERSVPRTLRTWWRPQPGWSAL